jgi:hypothetical protein
MALPELPEGERQSPRKKVNLDGKITLAREKEQAHINYRCWVLNLSSET